MNTRAFFACIFTALILGMSLCVVQYLRNEVSTLLEARKLEAAQGLQRLKAEDTAKLETLKFENAKQLQMLARINAPKKKTDFEIVKGDSQVRVPTFLVDHVNGKVWRYFRNYDTNNNPTDEGWTPLNPEDPVAGLLQ